LRLLEELDHVINILESQLDAWRTREVCHAIWLLATIAKDKQICVENPNRVAEACQNYGHLLYDHEVEMLRRWLVEIDQSRSRDHRSAGSRQL
jgi:hypothetical protein